MNLPTIIYTEGPSGKCPVQAEGMIDGHPFYFRSRGGHWALYVAAPGGDPVSHATWSYSEEYKGVHADDKPTLMYGLELKFGAGWAEEAECREFIERAALLWAQGEKK